MTRKFFVLAAAAVSLSACDSNESAGIMEAEKQPLSFAVTTAQVDGNQSCTDLGFDFGFKIDSRADFNGTYEVPGIGSVTVSTADQTTFGWTSTFPVDAVISKGGRNGLNLFTYEGEATAGSGLASPANQADGAPAAISHIDFCFDFELTVSKTAETSYTREFDWSVSKTASTSALTLDQGTTGSIEYTVAAAKAGHTDSEHAVAGTITITNSAPFAASISAVTESIVGANVDCAGLTTLAAGASATCTYSSGLPDATAFVNTVTVATAGEPIVLASGEALKLYGAGIVKGASGSAPVAFGAPTTLLDDVISLTDVVTIDGVATSTAIAGLGATYSVAIPAGETCRTFEVGNVVTLREGWSGETSTAATSTTANVVNCVVEPPPPPPITYRNETAFASGGTCFLSLGFDRWGWTLPTTTGTRTYDLYAGAGQCDTSKGTLVGSVTVSYDGAAATVTFALNPGIVLYESHVYAGAKPTPIARTGKTTWAPTVAPGQYSQIGTSTSYTITGLSGDIHVIAHAAVGIPNGQ